MARRPKPNQALVDMLEALLDMANAGAIDAAFVLLRFNDGTYDSALETDDFDDTVLQLRTEIMKMRDEKCGRPAKRN